MATARRQAQKEATRRDLKAAAARVFEAVGFDGASVGRITREAGVAQGTFYVHFDSKDALLDELLDDFDQASSAALLPLWAGAELATLDGTIRRSAEAFLDFWFARRAFVEAYARRALGRPDTLGLAEPLVAGLRRLADVLEAPLPRPDLAAHGVIGLWLRVVQRYLSDPTITRPDAVHALRAMTVGALRGLLPGLERREGPD